MYLLALLSYAHLVLSLEDDQIYCGNRFTHLCQAKGQHVACQFPVEGSGPNCQNYTRILFTAELRNHITFFINKRRQRIAAGLERVRGGKFIPRPKIMMQVEWDFELARLAQRLADQCYFVHDECRATLRYPHAGQSVGEVRWRHLSNSDELCAQRGIRRVFDAWWGERRRVDPYQLVTPFRITDKGLDWGHFSQIAVWTLRAVGCGAVRHGDDYPRLLLVCDFSHTNMLGERTLNPGDLAPCPERTRRKPHSNFPLLCAIVKEQVKQSKIIEDTLEDSEYSDDEEDFMDPGTMTDLEEFKESPFDQKTKPTPRRHEENWATRLKTTEVTFPEETTITKTWSTAPSYEDLDYDDEKDFTTSARTVTTTARKKSRTKFKPVPHRTTVVAEKDVRRKDEAKRRKMEGNEYSTSANEQEPQIWAGTDPPLLKNKPHVQKQERPRKYNEKNYTTTEGQVAYKHHLHHLRQRWKPMRDRPQRPGATALFRPSHVVLPVKVKPIIPTKISLKMDYDDVEQLWADTGFKPSWKINNKTVSNLLKTKTKKPIVDSILQKNLTLLFYPTPAE